MHYWRQHSFETLEHLEKRLAEIPELTDYVRYIELLAQGLRKEALKHIEDLISTLRALPADRHPLGRCQARDKTFFIPSVSAFSTGSNVLRAADPKAPFEPALSVS